MNKKRKTDKPALSFADSSVQGRSGDAQLVDDEEENDLVLSGEGRPRHTRNARNAQPKSPWLEAVSASGDGDDVSSEENFVVLPKRSTRNTRSKRTAATAGDQNDADEWAPDDEEVLMLDEEEIEEEDDDDFEPSTSRPAVKKPKLNQRKHLAMKRDREKLKREKQQQAAERLQQAHEDAELQRALELSRMAMEEEARQRQQQEDFLASINMNEEDISNGRAQATNSNSTKAEDISAIPGSSVVEDSDPEDIIIATIPSKRPSIHPPSQDMDQPEQSTANQSQELIDPELDDATQIAGGDDVVQNSHSPLMFSTPGDVEEVKIEQTNNDTISSTSGVSPSTRPKIQNTIDQALFRSARLGLRKRPLVEDVPTSVGQRRKIPCAVAVPEPPQLSTLDDLVLDNQDRRRVVVGGEGSADNSQISVGVDDVGSFRDERLDFPDSMNPPDDYDPGQPLVDTRNQPNNPSFYAPHKSCVKDYTKVILKLIHLYCRRLRNSQAKSAPRIDAGAPVVLGPYFAGTLRYRKRGVKAPMPVISLSDEEDNIQNNSQSQDGWISTVKPSERSGSKNNLWTRKRKRTNVIKDSDGSDLEDFEIGNAAKTLRTSADDIKIYDFDDDVSSFNENVPLFQLECIATVAGRGSKLVTDKPHTKSRPDDSPTQDASSRLVEAAVTSMVNEEKDDSQTLAYDDVYETETEEFTNEQTLQPSKDIVDQTEVLVDDKDSSEITKAPSTSDSTMKPLKTSTSNRVESEGSQSAEKSAADDSKYRVRSGRIRNESEVNEQNKLAGDTSENLQPDDPGLADSSTALSISRKSRKPKRKTLQNSQSVHEGADVTSSENREKGRGDVKTAQTSADRTTPSVNSNSGTETNRNKGTHDDVVENVETTSGLVREENAQRVSPVGHVSSMPKTGNSVEAPSVPEMGVSSSKETTPHKTGRKRSKDSEPFPIPPGLENHCVEELRYRFYLQRERDADGSSDGAVSGNSTRNRRQNNMSKEEMKAAVTEVCSDVLPTASASEGVSSSLSEKEVQQKHSQDSRREEHQQEEDDVASTSEPGESSRSKKSVLRTRERHSRHQSPGVASSSDDQDTRSRERTADAGPSNTSSSMSVAVSKRQSKRGQRSVPCGDQVETSTSVTKQERIGIQDGSVPSDEAETSTSDSVTRKQVAKVTQRPSTSEAEVKMTLSPSISNSVMKKSTAKVAQRTANSEEAEATLMSSTAGLVASKTDDVKQDGGYGDAVESSGLDSDGSGPSSRRREDGSGSGGGRQLEIGSSDEAAVSQDNARRTAKVVPTRRGSDEASTSADAQPINTKDNTKDREAQATVTRHQEVTKQQESSSARGGRTPRVADGLSQSDLGEEERHEGANPAVTSNEDEAQEEAEVSVECPLCGIQFTIQQIEAHASECNGPPEEEEEEEVAVVTRNTRQQPQQQQQEQQRQRSTRTRNQRANEEEEEGEGQVQGGDNQVEVDLTDEFSFPNSTAGRNQTSRKKPVHTYSRRLNSNVTNDAVEADDPIEDWLQAGGSNAPRSTRSQRNKRILTPSEDDEDDSEVIPDVLDHVDATIYRMAENNEIQFAEPRKGSHAARNARSPTPDEDDEDEPEPIEKCFLCNKHFPRSLYQAHVNEELDRQASNQTDSSEGAAEPLAAAGGSVRAGTGSVRRLLRNEQANTPKDNHQNAAAKSGPEIIDDDDDSDDIDEDDSDESDDEKPFDPANVSFGDSPIRAFKKISEQPNNLIDFKNQFKTTTKPVKSLYKELGKGKGRGKRKAYRGKRGRGKRRR